MMLDLAFHRDELKAGTVSAAAMVVLAVAAMVLFSGCIEQGCTQGSGKIAAETRAVDSFNSIDLQGWGDLYITEGQQQPLKIEGEDNILPMSEDGCQQRPAQDLHRRLYPDHGASAHLCHCLAFRKPGDKRRLYHHRPIKDNLACARP